MSTLPDGIQKEMSIEGVLFIHVDCVPSTMDTILAEFPYLLENPDKLIAFSASCQTSGRGGNKRLWVSRGKCIALSLACLTSGRDSPDIVLGHVLAVSTVRVLKRLYSNDEFVIKWPNDILIRGLKVGGVLVESHARPGDFRIVVLGIGINVDVPPDVIPKRPIWPGGSINQILKTEEISEDEIRRAVAIEFYHQLASWRHTGFRSFIPEIMKSLMSLNQMVTITFVDSNPISGLFTGIGDDGCLRLQLADGSIRDICSGEIRCC